MLACGSLGLIGVSQFLLSFRCVFFSTLFQRCGSVRFFPSSFFRRSSVIFVSHSAHTPTNFKTQCKSISALALPHKKTQLHGKKLRHPCVSKRSVAEHSFPQHNYHYSSFVLLLLHPLVPLATARHKLHQKILHSIHHYFLVPFPPLAQGCITCVVSSTTSAPSPPTTQYSGLLLNFIMPLNNPNLVKAVKDTTIMSLCR